MKKIEHKHKKCDCLQKGSYYVALENKQRKKILKEKKHTGSNKKKLSKQLTKQKRNPYFSEKSQIVVSSPISL